MKEIFGLPIGQLLAASTAVCVGGLAILFFLAVRNRVFFKMAARNIPRRRTQTMLIVFGLMLATLLFSVSFTTGETLTKSIRLMALKGLGEVDELVTAQQQGQGMQTIMGGGIGPASYIDEAVSSKIGHALEQDQHVDGVAPMLQLSTSVLNPLTKLSEPQVIALGHDPNQMSGFDRPVDAEGNYLDLKALGPDQIYISTELAERTAAGQGTELEVYLGRDPIALQVAGVYERGANPATGPSLVMTLARLQQLTGLDGRISGVMVTNLGDALAGAAYSDEVAEKLEPLLGPDHLQVDKIKQQTLATADQSGAMFTGFFLLIGQFSIIAGILLIFLIYVMLAAERQHELGIMRAVGGRRAQIVQLFAFEGALYALLAAAVGSLLGVAVGWGMVRLLSLAFDRTAMPLEFAYSWRNIALAYTLGMALTFGVSLLASWRVSRLNIVRAVRDLPEEQRPNRNKGIDLALALASIITGALVVFISIRNRDMTVFMVGTSLFIVGIPLLLRRYGLGDRAVFTMVGVGILVWWLLPDNPLVRILPPMNQKMEMFFVSGLMIVIGAILTVMYNTDLILGAIMRIFGRVRGLPPVLRTAVSYPLQNRFRTGMTLAMFSLIVFTLVGMSVMIASQTAVFEDTERMTGGFDIRASTSNILNPIPDLRASLEERGGLGDEFEYISGISILPARIRQAGTDGDLSDLYLSGVDEEYMSRVTYHFLMKAKGYHTDGDVWQALSSEPDTVVVSALMVQAKVSSSMSVRSELLPQFEGFWLEEKTLPETYLEVVNPFTGANHRLKVIGVLEQAAVTSGSLILSSRKTLNGLLFGQEIPPQVYLLKVKPGVDPVSAARDLEAAFLDRGLQANVMSQEIRDMSETLILVVNLMTGFMGMGLIVGLAALGVIAARAVVERWKEVGIMRAVGFQRSMVQLSFLIESSFVALLGILIGVFLGITLAPQIVNLAKQQIEGFTLCIPTLRITAIALAAYVASFLTTYLPARKAAGIYPAEALRYE